MASSAAPDDAVKPNIIDRSIEVIAKVVSYSFALSVAVTIYDVFCDVALKSPTVWVYDVVTTAIAMAFLIGGSYALMRREHIQITAIYGKYSKRTRHRVDMVSGLLTMVYLAAFAWFSYDMAAISVEDWEVGGSAWAQPTPVVVKVSMVLGAALMIIQAISNFIGDWKSQRRGH